MKPILFCLSLALFSGCSYMTSKTYDPQTGKPTTMVRAFDFFDANSKMNKFHNRSTLTVSNEWSPGTTIGSLNQEASATNLSGVLEAITRGAVQGLK